MKASYVFSYLNIISHLYNQRLHLKYDKANLCTDNKNV